MSIPRETEQFPMCAPLRAAATSGDQRAGFRGGSGVGAAAVISPPLSHLTGLFTPACFQGANILRLPSFRSASGPQKKKNHHRISSLSSPCPHLPNSLSVRFFTLLPAGASLFIINCLLISCKTVMVFSRGNVTDFCG